MTEYGFLLLLIPNAQLACQVSRRLLDLLVGELHCGCCFRNFKRFTCCHCRLNEQRTHRNGKKAHFEVSNNAINSKGNAFGGEFTETILHPVFTDNS